MGVFNNIFHSVTDCANTGWWNPSSVIFIILMNRWLDMWKMFSWFYVNDLTGPDSVILEAECAVLLIQYEPFSINLIKAHCRVWILMHPQRVLISTVIFWSSPTLIWQWECPCALIKQWPLFWFINRDQCLISVPPTSTKAIPLKASALKDRVPGKREWASERAS